MKTTDLTWDMTVLTRQHIEFAEQLHSLSDRELNSRIQHGSWSVLECLQHLNLYGNFYLPEIESSLRNTKEKPDPEFRPGFLGDYFAKSMQPKAKLNKMKTFKATDPINSKLDRNVINTFLEQQNRLLELLVASKNVNLNNTKTGISIAKWIRIRLGDTFRFVIYHNQRHVLQAERVLAYQIKAKEKSEA